MKRVYKVSYQCNYLSEVVELGYTDDINGFIDILTLELKDVATIKKVKRPSFFSYSKNTIYLRVKLLEYVHHTINNQFFLLQYVEKPKNSKVIANSAIPLIQTRYWY